MATTRRHDVKDLALAGEGIRRIEWADRNMAVTLEGTVQRGHTFAIVDEVDSILIDEARTPLIISGEPETAAKTYYDFARVVRELEGAPLTRKAMKGEDETELSGADFLYDEKFKTVSPAQTALDKVERMQLLYRINRSGTTVLMVTHDREMVDKMRKRVIQLEEGRLARDERRGGYAGE